MAKGINIEKIFAEIDKGELEEQKDAFIEIGRHINANIETEKVKLQESINILNILQEQVTPNVNN